MSRRTPGGSGAAAGDPIEFAMSWGGRGRVKHVVARSGMARCGWKTDPSVPPKGKTCALCLRSLAADELEQQARAEARKRRSPKAIA